MKRKKEWLVVLLAVALVVTVSVVVTLVATQPELRPGEEPNLVQRLMGMEAESLEVPPEIPLQAAYQACRSRIIQDTQGDLINLSYDNRASRYQAADGFYQIFMNVYLRSDDGSIYSRCDVSSVTGEILEFRLKADQGFLFSF